MKAQPRSFKVLLGLLIFVVGLELVAPFVVQSVGVDGPGQLNLERQFNSMIARGVWIPRWVPEGFHGFGSPAFYFYPPLAFYLTASLQTLTGITNPYTLFQFAGLIGTVASFASAWYLFAMLGARGWPLMFGSFLYAFGPFRIAELYSRSSLSSHIGYVFVPLIAAGIIKLFSTNPNTRIRGVLLTAIIGALLVLTSIPLTLLIGIAIVAVMIALHREINARGLLLLVGAGLVSLLLSLWYLCSVVTYQRFAQLATLTAKREFIIDDLLHLQNLPTLFHVGIIVAGIATAILAALPARAWLGYSAVERAVLRSGLAITVVVVLLELPIVRSFLWGSVPYLALIQGSWRFFILLLLFIAMFVALAKTRKLVAASNVIVLIFGVSAILPAMMIVFNLHLFPHHNDPLTDQMEYAPAYTLSNQAALDSLLPASAPIILSSSHETKPSDHIVSIRGTMTSDEYDVQLAANRQVTFHRFYWPAWHLTVNGHTVQSYPDGLGRATTTLEAGHYSAIWHLEQSPLEWAGRWISELAFGGMLATLVIGLFRGWFKQNSSAT
ncbi:MAG: hypothetical protein Q8922_10270 [Bacteroidota bacterium]|nr:hypothetical protein [Bacteroidota bacterium]MDP4233919.1 hypothetical protein [Bacteroidota bacterium]MDP4242831.1 hypothetical protein [Bacteroidota bacterium]MDP4288309.1 hypothetical protein [Bacteroidota bacterium]